MLRKGQRATSPLLEVIALNAADAVAAAQGGADRLEVVTDMASDGLTPSLLTVNQIREACDLPLRVMLRTEPDFLCHDLDRLQDKAAALAQAGADAFVLGFLNRDHTMDLDSLAAIADSLTVPWTCHRAIDYAVDYDKAISQVVALPGLDQILTGGGPEGLGTHLDKVVSQADSGLLMAGGGLTTAAVPRLLAAGVRAFHIGSGARPDWHSGVRPECVAPWRALLDA